MFVYVITSTTLIISLISIVLLLKGAQGKETKARKNLGLTFLFLALWGATTIINSLSIESINLLVFSTRLSYVTGIWLLYSLVTFSGELCVEKFKLNKKNKRVIVMPLIALSILTLFSNQIIVSVTESPDTGSKPILGRFFIIYVFFLLPIFLLVLRNVYLAYKYSKGTTLLRLRYFFIGVFVSALLIVISSLLLPMINIDIFVAYSFLGVLPTVLFSTYSITKHRLFGIRFVLGRSIYLALIAIIPFCTFYFVFSLQTLLWGSIFEPEALITGFFVSMGFVYLLLFANTRLKTVIDEKIVNTGFNPEKVREKLAKDLSTELDLGNVGTKVLKAIHDTISPAGTGIVLFENNQRRVLFRRVRELRLKSAAKELLNVLDYWAESNQSYPLIQEELLRIEEEISDKLQEKLKTILAFMKKRKIACIFPLDRKVHLNGVLLLGEKENDSAYTVQDIDFIDSIVTNVSVAIGRALLYEQVQNFAETLEKKVDTATEELEEKAKQLNRKNRALEKAAQRERDMMDIVGHELRTPSSIVKNALGYIKMLDRMGKLSTVKLKKYLDKSTEAIEREIKLINTFLGATKVENGQMQFDPTKFSLTELVKQVVSENKLRASQKGLKLKYIKPKQEVPFIDADRTRIAEVIDNLITNGIKYTRRGSVEVWCDSDLRNKTVSVFIKDTGVGVSAKDQKKLFTKFGRIRNYIAKEERMAQIVRPGGTGLGLYLAKGIVVLHGGDVDVKSSLGKGSMFTFTLPIENKISKKNLINPIFAKKGNKNVFARLDLSQKKA
ncbi:MAG: ATP-binding protein [Patescibacteria group bacterium]